jgi:hypothetical protein
VLDSALGDVCIAILEKVMASAARLAVIEALQENTTETLDNERRCGFYFPRPTQTPPEVYLTLQRAWTDRKTALSTSLASYELRNGIKGAPLRRRLGYFTVDPIELERRKLEEDAKLLAMRHSFNICAQMMHEETCTRRFNDWEHSVMHRESREMRGEDQLSAHSRSEERSYDMRSSQTKFELRRWQLKSAALGRRRRNLDRAQMAWEDSYSSRCRAQNLANNSFEGILLKDRATGKLILPDWLALPVDWGLWSIDAQIAHVFRSTVARNRSLAANGKAKRAEMLLNRYEEEQKTFWERRWEIALYNHEAAELDSMLLQEEVEATDRHLKVIIRRMLTSQTNCKLLAESELSTKVLI